MECLHIYYVEHRWQIPKKCAIYYMVSVSTISTIIITIAEDEKKEIRFDVAARQVSIGHQNH